MFDLCIQQSNYLLSKQKTELDNAVICREAKQIPACKSIENRQIFHFQTDSVADYRTRVKNILVFAVVHGDEPEGGLVALRWARRLLDLQSRNKWRIIPILNPDGMYKNQRVNARGVDLNRNFPSSDWHALALKYWKTRKDADPRRYPGPSAGSESETGCAVDHIQQFNPDLIVSIHTPYGILDFDGPKLNFPHFANLPWRQLGTFPGSLGRYMWKDKSIPVLTIELKDSSILAKIDEIDKLQDISGTVALKVEEKLAHSSNPH